MLLSAEAHKNYAACQRQRLRKNDSEYVRRHRIYFVYLHSVLVICILDFVVDIRRVFTCEHTDILQ